MRRKRGEQAQPSDENYYSDENIDDADLVRSVYDKYNDESVISDSSMYQYIKNDRKISSNRSLKSRPRGPFS